MFGQREDSGVNDAAATMGAPIVPPAVDNNAPAPAASPSPTPDYSSPFGPPSAPEITPPAPMPTPVVHPSSTPPVAATNEADEEATNEELVRMKQEALKHLQPLVDTLQQSPEEEFRTLMMMIQATDDKSMLRKALEAAKKIGDDKVRAQAMLDVINEINYFTQSGGVL